MAITSFKDMLLDARQRHYAVPMFDVSNTTMMRAAVEVAQEEKAPVILASLLPDIEDQRLGYWYNSAVYAAKQADVPVCIHLDHAVDADTCRKCIEQGYQSVMIDASASSFEDNAALSGEVVKMAHAKGVHVEAELGHVASGFTGGVTGVSESGLSNDTETIFTDPESVVKFVEMTGVDALAVSVGTTHGVYISAPELNIPLLKEINRVSPVPLVLHGGSGTPEDQLVQAISNGVAKINIYSELTAAWNTAMRDFLNKRTEMTCWFRVAWDEPERAMREVIRAKIRMFRANNRY